MCNKHFENRMDKHKSYFQKCFKWGILYRKLARKNSNYFPDLKQVAQRATIAHLSPVCQHPLISNKPASKVIKNLNSFQIREQLFFLGLSTSNVSRLNLPEIKPLVVFKHVLVTKKQASMKTSLSHFNSLAQGP